MTTAFLFLSLCLFLVIGMPIAIALGLASVLSALFFTHDSLAALVLQFNKTMTLYTLLAVPFFILSGGVMNTGGSARRLVNFANALVGHIPGGLGVASVFACMMFAAVSGSSPATVVAIGTIAIGGMARSGYTKEFAAGLLCNAGTLGILIPPSIPMIVYCTVTEESVGRLFIAGILPGIVLGIMFMCTVYVLARIYDLPCQPRVSWRDTWIAFREAVWALMLIVIILGGIYGGVFTPTEAAAVAAVYAFFVSVVVYKDTRLADIPNVLAHAGKMIVMLLFIVGNAFLFGHILVSERIPQAITNAIIAAHMPVWLFLLVINIIMLIAGDFMEPAVIILILAPIFLPIAVKLGINPIHLGIIMVVNMEIGMVTLPVGFNLYVTSSITGMDFYAVFKAALPWMAVLLIFLQIVTYLPSLSLILPNALFGKTVSMVEPLLKLASSGPGP